MVRPERAPLSARVEADETYLGGPRPGTPGRGATGKIRVAGAVESGRGQARGRRLGRLRLAVVADVSANSLEGFLGQNVALAGGRGDRRLVRLRRPRRRRLRPRAAQPQRQLGRRGAPPAGDPPGVRPRQALAAGTHHGAVSAKHLPADLDEFVFRFNRRTAKRLSHRFARVH